MMQAKVRISNANQTHFHLNLKARLAYGIIKFLKFDPSIANQQSVNMLIFIL